MPSQSGHKRTINWEFTNEIAKAKDISLTCAECNTTVVYVLAFRLSKRMVCRGCGCEIDPVELEICKLSANPPDIRTLTEFEH